MSNRSNCFTYSKTAAATENNPSLLSSRLAFGVLLMLGSLATVPSMAAATAAPTTLTWSSVAIGSAGGPKTVTLTNNDTAPETIGSITFSGTNPKDFVIYEQTCGTSLQPAASCSVTVLFKPSATGARKATLSFIDSASNSPQAVSVSGNGTPGSGTVSLSSASLAFGSVAVGVASAPLTETLTNSSAAALTISKVAISGTGAADFSVSSNTCSASLAPAASCKVAVVFKPLASGAFAASLSFTNSASNTSQAVPLSGTGGAASKTVAATPSTLAFATVAVGSPSATLTGTLTNSTAASITLSSPTLSGSDATDFELASKTCGTALAPSASCTVTLVFKPLAAGARTATLAFPDSATNSPQKIALSGTGSTATSVGSLSVSPGSLAWGAMNVGSLSSSQVVTLHNGGSSNVPLSSLALTSTDPGDFEIAGSTCGSSLAAGGSCAVTLAFRPAAAGTRVALLSFADSATNSPQTVELSGQGEPAPVEAASITVDFGSRSQKQIAIPPHVLGVEYLDSLPDSASRTTVVEAGFQTSRVHANVTAVYATTTPDWTKIDGSIKTFKALGVHPILIIDLTPPWLVPSPVLCKTAPDTSVPSDLTKWGEMAASFVEHLDANFPGVVQDYEIWNEPNNTGALCATDKLDAYLGIYAAAAPLMKAQAKADGASIRIGGPASAGVAWPSLLTDPRTAPYVDFYSYHLYLSTPSQIAAGMSWDGTGGKPSLLSMILNNPAGEQARYLEAMSYVKAGATPLGAKMPIYFSEFNDNWAFEADCCRNDPTYSPLFNSMAVAEIFNAVYAGANQVPTKMIYYASAQKPFCILGVENAAMDCTPALSDAQLTPYPQLYTYQLISAPAYLDLVDGGYMASSVTLSSAAKAQGLVATAYYTATTDSILIINPTNSSFAGVTVQSSNPGFTSPQATLFTINAANRKISTWPASLISVTNGAQATFDMPAHSVLALSLKSN